MLQNDIIILVYHFYWLRTIEIAEAEIFCE